MHDFPQVGILTNKLLQRRLALDGYHLTEHTHGLWKHKTHPVWFLLVVDDLGIKYVGRENTEHLIASIKNDLRFQVTGQAVHTLD
jgi:hypothetical protein